MCWYEKPALNRFRPIVTARSANTGPKLGRRPSERAEGFVEGVGEAAGGRAERERRELHQHQRVEAADDADGGIVELVGVDRAEVRDVREAGRDRPGQRDFAQDQVRQELGEVGRRRLCRGGRGNRERKAEQEACVV